MISFDAKLVLHLSSRPKGLMKGDEIMSDEWIESTVNRIKQHEEDQRRTKDYELLRETKIGRAEGDLFEELQKTLKTTIEKLNERFPGPQKRYGIKTRWDSIEITGPHELSFDIKHDSDKHELDLSLYVGSSQPRIDEQVKIDLNESEEVCFKWQGSCIGVTKLAHALLDLVIDNSL